MNGTPRTSFSLKRAVSDPEGELKPRLPLPAAVTEEELRQFLASVHVVPGPRDELAAYCHQDFRRFVYTYGLARDLSGVALELGANPYFTTMLLREFTDLELVLANYFDESFPVDGDRAAQDLVFSDFSSGRERQVSLEFRHFNIETERFPFADSSFDVVLFCEILEHLLMDPVAVLREVKRVLRPSGALILTTPNVNRLENVTRMLGGLNIYDPYSGYGPYGRHNREYNKHELSLLLDYVGFEFDVLESADVHENAATRYESLASLDPLLEFRRADLGQYLFVRAFSRRRGGEKRPRFLYRSYPPAELEPPD
jgi:SAM-dependent methyltransferase